MNYEAFKNMIAEQIKGYLPEEYRNWKVVVKWVKMVNGMREILQLSPGSEMKATPIIYLDQLYRRYRQEKGAEQILKEAAAQFLYGMEYLKHHRGFLPEENPDGRIIYTLINTEKNRHMLEGVPHREIMDLSVIYRFVVEDRQEGMNSFVITDDLAEYFHLTEEELYLEAAKNTPEFMPVSVIPAEPMGIVICNQKGVLGAAAMLYEGVLSEAAAFLNSDLYILPSSVHEVIAVAAGENCVSDLRSVVACVNRTVVKDCDFLSDQVYFFDRRDRKLKPAADERVS